MSEETQEKIKEVCDNLNTFLKIKNKKYGDSALKQLNIFNKKGEESSICIRINDKIMRIYNSDKLNKNDIVDLTGYLILLLIERGWDIFDDIIE